MIGVPTTPGVYLFKDVKGVVLYVGKAKRLRPRVRSYVATDHPEWSKTRVLMEHVADLETIVVPTEEHALLGEMQDVYGHLFSPASYGLKS